MKYNRSKKGGFTLIEMLIVIAIIGILSSIVLVGLGPVQRRGRDARRQSDLRQAQNGLELYYGKCSHYPGGSNCEAAGGGMSWADMAKAIVGAGLGVSQIPNDPSSQGGTDAATNYQYGTDGSTYVIGAKLEDGTAAALKDDLDGKQYGVDCADPVYCISL